MNAMQPPQNIEEIKAGLETTEKGGVRQSIRNCLTVFQRDPLLSGAIAYNILTDRKDIIKPIGFHRESTALNDTDMKYLLLYLEETYGLPMWGFMWARTGTEAPSCCIVATLSSIQSWTPAIGNPTFTPTGG